MTREEYQCECIGGPADGQVVTVRPDSNSIMHVAGGRYSYQPSDRSLRYIGEVS